MYILLKSNDDQWNKESLPFISRRFLAANAMATICTGGAVTRHGIDQMATIIILNSNSILSIARRLT